MLYGNGTIAQQVERSVEARVAEVRFLLVPLPISLEQALPLYRFPGKITGPDVAEAKSGVSHVWCQWIAHLPSKQNGWVRIPLRALPGDLACNNRKERESCEETNRDITGGEILRKRLR